jgi:glycosyltransferase involved in cell wall biosynthesis
MTLKKPIRVLHCFNSLGVGGIETWLVNILRLHSDELRFDFILNELGGQYEEEVRSYGCQIYHAPPIRKFSENLRFVEKVLRENKYDVYHWHGDEFMGDGMKVAAKVGVPVRIAHCHNTKLARGKMSLEMWVRLLRFKTIDRLRNRQYATDILGCSIDAGRFLMGEKWESDSRCRVLYCGVLLEHFRKTENLWSREDFRKTHGIPEEAIVVGHVGSMGPTLQKNHPFILEVFAELMKKDKRYYLFLAGDGPHRPALEKKVKDMGLQAHVIMPGIFNDVPSLMIYGFDVHFLPSRWEGLPVAGLEAVASGLFTVCSDTIVRDFTDYFPTRVETVSLDSGVTHWADKVMMGVGRRISTLEGTKLVESSPFSIEGSMNNMLDIYKKRLACRL